MCRRPRWRMKFPGTRRLRFCPRRRPRYARGDEHNVLARGKARYARRKPERKQEKQNHAVRRDARRKRPGRLWNLPRGDAELEQRSLFFSIKSPGDTDAKSAAESDPLAYAIDRGGGGRYSGLSCQFGEPGDDPPDDQEARDKARPQHRCRPQPSATHSLRRKRKADGMEPCLSGPAIMAAPDFATGSAQHSLHSAPPVGPMHARRSAVRAMLFLVFLLSGYDEPSSRRLRSSIRPSVRVVPGSRR